MNFIVSPSVIIGMRASTSASVTVRRRRRFVSMTFMGGCSRKSGSDIVAVVVCDVERSSEMASNDELFDGFGVKRGVCSVSLMFEAVLCVGGWFYSIDKFWRRNGGDGAMVSRDYCRYVITAVIHTEVISSVFRESLTKSNPRIRPIGETKGERVTHSRSLIASNKQTIRY